MKIERYKKGSGGKYRILLDNGEVLILYEDVILKFNLLLKKDISDKDLIEINKYNQECEVYYVALDSVNRRFKSVYELEEVLRRKQYSKEFIALAVEKLLKQGYLDDRLFSKSYINSQILTTNKGPLKIKRELLDKKVLLEIIDEELLNYSEDEQLVKIEKLTTKMLKTNRNRGGIVLKQKIINDLKNLGYENDLITKIVSQQNFSNNDDIRKKEYEKLRKRLSRKYSGVELERKIKEKLYQKGLYYEE